MTTVAIVPGKDCSSRGYASQDKYLHTQRGETTTVIMMLIHSKMSCYTVAHTHCMCIHKDFAVDTQKQGILIWRSLILLCNTFSVCKDFI